MIFKLVLVCALVGSPALGSAVKGYAQREEATKGASRPLLAPIEQQRLVVEQQREIKGAQKLEQIPEQKAEEFQQQQQQQQDLKTEEFQQQREEIQQQELKGSSRYEAKPQLSRDELAKGQQREEPAKGQREELSKQKVEQQKELQQQEKFEQQQRTNDFDSQIELKEEQRRLEESPSVQPILPLTIVEETRGQIQQQLLDSGVKGSASFAQAPLAEAEPYAFSYQVEGSSRSESGDTKGVVRGQYTLQGADGMSRVVDYVADHNGFRASVNTNEFGTEAKSPANIALRSSQPSAEDITLRLEGKTKEEELRSDKQTKTSSKLDQNWSAKGLLPVPQAAPLAKGQRLVQPQQQEELFQQQEPIKSAELQQPKSLKAAQPRSSFESATAHRNYRQPAYLIRPAPAAPARGPLPVVAQPVAARPLVPAISRSYLQRVRYPPSPVQSGLRSHYEPLVQPVANARVSFYAEPPADVSESSSSSFESPELDS